MTEFLEKLTTLQARLEHFLDKRLLETTALEQALRYAVLGGGKRLRAALVYLTGEALGLPYHALDHAAAAIECMHAYSLVHDDLPSMDNDDWRRGKAACHKAYDEATAILVGDALQTMAFELLAHQPLLSSKAMLLQIQHLSKACGTQGLVGGQACDLALLSQKTPVTQETLESLHQLKTGALLQCSIQLAIAAQEKTPFPLAWNTALCTYGEKIGLAFQIQDDILDLTASTLVLGKTAAKDAAAHKPTFATILGLTAARNSAKTLQREAIAALEPLTKKASSLTALADYMIERAY